MAAQVVKTEACDSIRLMVFNYNVVAIKFSIIRKLLHMSLVINFDLMCPDLI